MDELPVLSERTLESMRKLKELRANRGEVDPSVEDDLPILDNGGTVAVMYKRPKKARQEDENEEGE